MVRPRFFWKGCLEFHALFFGWCVCYWQVILVWTPQQLSQLRFVCCTGHNGLPVAVEPLSPALQSECSADRHSLQHNVELSPCERRANVNRRANRDCLDGRDDVNLGPADIVQTSENNVFLLQGRFTPKTCGRINPSHRFVVSCSVLETPAFSPVQRIQMARGAQSAIKIYVRN